MSIKLIVIGIPCFNKSAIKFIFIKKNLKVINWARSDFNTLTKIYIKLMNWDRIVAIANPETPKAGIIPNPNTNNGFKIIFKKKLIINIFR